MRNAQLGEAQTGIKTAGRNSNKLRYAYDTTVTAESEEELDRLLMKVKGESEKPGLKLKIQKTKIMASSLITSALKSLQMLTTAMKLKYLLLGRKAMTNLESILKSRDITLPMKVCLVKAMVSPVVMYGCES